MVDSVAELHKSSIYTLVLFRTGGIGCVSPIGISYREGWNKLTNEWLESRSRSTDYCEIDFDGGPICGGGAVPGRVLWMLSQNHQGVQAKYRHYTDEPTEGQDDQKRDLLHLLYVQSPYGFHGQNSNEQISYDVEAGVGVI